MAQSGREVDRNNIWWNFLTKRPHFPVCDGHSAGRDTPRSASATAVWRIRESFPTEKKCRKTFTKSACLTASCRQGLTKLKNSLPGCAIHTGSQTPNAKFGLNHDTIETKKKKINPIIRQRALHVFIFKH